MKSIRTSYDGDDDDDELRLSSLSSSSPQSPSSSSLIALQRTSFIRGSILLPLFQSLLLVGHFHILVVAANANATTAVPPLSSLQKQKQQAQTLRKQDLWYNEHQQSNDVVVVITAADAAADDANVSSSRMPLSYHLDNDSHHDNHYANATLPIRKQATTTDDINATAVDDFLVNIISTNTQTIKTNNMAGSDTSDTQQRPKLQHPTISIGDLQTHTATATAKDRIQHLTFTQKIWKFLQQPLPWQPRQRRRRQQTNDWISQYFIQSETYAEQIKDFILSSLFGISSLSAKRRTAAVAAAANQQLQPMSLSSHRRMEDAAAAAGDDDVYNNYNSNNKYLNDDDSVRQKWGDTDACRSFLYTFLEGTTDTRDICEGIMNAYVAAACSMSKSYSNNKKHSQESSGYDDHDDYFEGAEHQCCQPLQQHISDYCEEDTLLSNYHLLIAASVLLLCECAKAVVVRNQIHFLPEAGVCILVGTVLGVILRLFFQFEGDIDKLSFNDELFLSLLLPPIIFEAALSVSKFEFKRRRGAIFMFSVFGTVISTFSTGLMVHYTSKWSSAETFPMLDSLVFGALISSIDPVAILSVLANLNLDQRDTIFILVFGESLLNDGIAITVFQTLVNRFHGKTTDSTTSVDEILDACATFMISMFGSIVIGLACGCGAWAYFNMLGDLLPPVMEVGSFFLWALIPYYISDGVGWSGIVSIVAVGFFMDIYIAGPKGTAQDVDLKTSMSVSPSRRPRHNEVIPRVNSNGYRGMNDDESGSRHVIHSVDSMQTSRSIGPLPSTERINMSAIADRHVRFVAHLTSHLAENAIFAYIGLFLFSNQYDWNATLIAIGISSCVLSRVLMVVIVSWLLSHIYKCRGVPAFGSNSSRTAAAIQNPRTQAVLVLAGLRGAVSLALVENVPIKNNVTGQGCEYKQVMKGMTSACIVFTTFVFGGGAYYILPHLGIRQDGGGSPTDHGRNGVDGTGDGITDPYSPPISPMPTLPCAGDTTTTNKSSSMRINLCTAAKKCIAGTNDDEEDSLYKEDPSISLQPVRQHMMIVKLDEKSMNGKTVTTDPYHYTADKSHPII